MGRKRSAYNLNLAKEFESGNYRIDEFCNQHGIKKHQLYYWRKKMRSAADQSKSGSFIPVRKKFYPTTFYYWKKKLTVYGEVSLDHKRMNLSNFF